MKRNLREWLPTTLLCGLLVGVAIASNRLLSAQSSSPSAQEDIVLAEEPAESLASAERQTVRRPPRPFHAPTARSLPSLPIISSNVSERAAMIDKIRSELPTVAEESKAHIDERRAILNEQRSKVELERRERLKPKARSLERIQ